MYVQLQQISKGGNSQYLSSVIKNDPILNIFITESFKLHSKDLDVKSVNKQSQDNILLLHSMIYRVFIW